MDIKLFSRLRSRAAAFTHDVLVIPAAWLMAYWVRYNLENIPDRFFEAALSILPVIIITQAISYWSFGLYRGVWRFASIPDFIRIGKSVAVGVIFSSVIIFLMTRMQYIPRSVIPLYTFFLFGLLTGNRFIYRCIKDKRFSYQSGTRVLIVGALALETQESRRGCESNPGGIAGHATPGQDVYRPDQSRV